MAATINYTPKSKLRVGLVVPHIFMHKVLLPNVIFSPGSIALDLAKGLEDSGLDVTLFTPGPVKTKVRNLNVDLTQFEEELKQRGYGYLEMLKKHPLSFVSIARQVQGELIAKAYEMSNNGELDIVHIYTNEEDIGLTFAGLCRSPVIFTHHDPFNFLINYRHVFPKYKDRNWVSISLAQRRGMPVDTNWVGNVYHGIPAADFKPEYSDDSDYFVYVGRIIEPKGLHLAIGAVKKFNTNNKTSFKLKIAGKHYAGHKKDSYWQNVIEPTIDGKEVEYVGFLNKPEKAKLISNARATIVPSIFNEPFGLVAIESLACATPVIAVDSGALREILSNPKTGVLAKREFDIGQELNEPKTISNLCTALSKVSELSRRQCREEFESRFTVERMSAGYKEIYKKLAGTKE